MDFTFLDFESDILVGLHASSKSFRDILKLYSVDWNDLQLIFGTSAQMELIAFLETTDTLVPVYNSKGRQKKEERMRGVLPLSYCILLQEPAIMVASTLCQEFQRYLQRCLI